MNCDSKTEIFAVQTEYEKDLEEYQKEHSPSASEDSRTKKFKPKPDVIYLKLFPDDHPLSVEEQMFFIRVTEGIFGYKEQVRNETIKMLSIDHNITTITPYLCIFIRQAIYTNIVFTDLTLLIYSVRMVKSLLSNPHITLKKFIHEILPPILSCALVKKICKYYHDNHWTLRDFSAYVVAMICHIYNTKMNNITQRVVNIYLQAIQDAGKPLTTVYGAVKGLSSLGEEAIRTYLFPNIALLSNRICMNLERKPIYPEDKQYMIEAKHVLDLIVSVASPILYKTQNTNDNGASFIRDFGYLGKLLYVQVKTIEKTEMERKMSCPNFVYLINNNESGGGRQEILHKVSIEPIPAKKSR